MHTSDSWCHVVHVRKGLGDGVSRMQSWCDHECESLWGRVYVNWHVDAWCFEHAEDELRFRLTWHDYVLNV